MITKVIDKVVGKNSMWAVLKLPNDILGKGPWDDVPEAMNNYGSVAVLPKRGPSGLRADAVRHARLYRNETDTDDQSGDGMRAGRAQD